MAKVKSYSRVDGRNIFNIKEKEEKRAKDLFFKIKNIPDSDTDNYRILRSCRDSSGKTLFFIATGETDQTEELKKNSKMYAIIVDENGLATEGSILDIIDPYNCSKEMHEFKQSNGWKFQT